MGWKQSFLILWKLSEESGSCGVVKSCAVIFTFVSSIIDLHNNMFRQIPRSEAVSSGQHKLGRHQRAKASRLIYPILKCWTRKKSYDILRRSGCTEHVQVCEKETWKIHIDEDKRHPRVRCLFHVIIGAIFHVKTTQTLHFFIVWIEAQQHTSPTLTIIIECKRMRG